MSERTFYRKISLILEPATLFSQLLPLFWNLPRGSVAMRMPSLRGLENCKHRSYPFENVVRPCGKILMKYQKNFQEAITQTEPLQSLRWRHNEWDGVSNHQPHDCLLNCLSGCRAKKTSKPRVTGLCAGNSPENGEFPAQMSSNAETVSIWWRHHVKWASWRLTSQAPWLLGQRLVQPNIKEKSRLRITDPSWWESPGEWWILHTKGKQCGKGFQVITSACPRPVTIKTHLLGRFIKNVSVCTKYQNISSL